MAVTSVGSLTSTDLSSDTQIRVIGPIDCENEQNCLEVCLSTILRKLLLSENNFQS